MESKMTFNQLEDDDTIGFPDEIKLEQVEVSAGDYMSPAPLPPGQVKTLFEQLKNSGEATGKYALEYKNLETAVDGIIHTLNMEALEGTSKLDPGKNAHEMWL